jgi:hypothetical protein
MNATIESLDKKLDTLGGEMRTQTNALANIDRNTKAMAVVALQDQEARDRIYDRLADGLLKLARSIGVGVLVVMILALVATFKQELHANFGNNASIDIGSKEKPK